MPSENCLAFPEQKEKNVKFFHTSIKIYPSLKYHLTEEDLETTMEDFEEEVEDCLS